jgi:hypothetical protein
MNHEQQKPISVDIKDPRVRLIVPAKPKPKPHWFWGNFGGWALVLYCIILIILGE